MSDYNQLVSINENLETSNADLSAIETNTATTASNTGSAVGLLNNIGINTGNTDINTGVIANSNQLIQIATDVINTSTALLATTVSGGKLLTDCTVTQDKYQEIYAYQFTKLLDPTVWDTDISGGTILVNGVEDSIALRTQNAAHWVSIRLRNEPLITSTTMRFRFLVDPQTNTGTKTFWGLRDEQLTSTTFTNGFEYGFAVQGGSFRLLAGDSASPISSGAFNGTYTGNLTQYGIYTMEINIGAATNIKYYYEQDETPETLIHTEFYQERNIHGATETFYVIGGGDEHIRLSAFSRSANNNQISSTTPHYTVCTARTSNGANLGYLLGIRSVAVTNSSPGFRLIEIILGQDTNGQVFEVQARLDMPTVTNAAFTEIRLNTDMESDIAADNDDGTNTVLDGGTLFWAGLTGVQNMIAFDVSDAHLVVPPGSTLTFVSTRLLSTGNTDLMIYVRFAEN